MIKTINSSKKKNKMKEEENPQLIRINEKMEGVEKNLEKITQFFNGTNAKLEELDLK